MTHTLLVNWATRHNVSPEAVADLVNLLATAAPSDPQPTGGSEAAAQAAIRLEAPRQHCTLWRNNVGAAQDRHGRPVRYGLANDSGELNRSVKSSDLIGMVPLLIRREHVGTSVAVFAAFEVKKPGWVYRRTERERAQLRYMNLVRMAGGCTGFVRSSAEFTQVVEAYRDE